MAVGAWLSSADPGVADVMAGSDLDFVVVDLQHSLADESVVRSARRSFPDTGPKLLARVASNDAPRIGCALDSGAIGVVVPLVNSAAEAAAAVAASRYPPFGNRSYGPMAVQPTNDPTTPGNAPQCFAMIETGAAVRDAESIVRTPGLTGVLVGVVDLAVELGLAPFAFASNTLPAPLHDALEAVVAACRSNQVIAAMGGSSVGDAIRSTHLGFEMVMIGGEKAMLKSGIARALVAFEDGESGNAPQAVSMRRP